MGYQQILRVKNGDIEQIQAALDEVCGKGKYDIEVRTYLLLLHLIPMPSSLREGKLANQTWSAKLAQSSRPMDYHVRKATIRSKCI